MGRPFHRHPWRASLAALVLSWAAVSSFGAHAQAPGGTPDDPAALFQNGEWSRAGAGFSCRAAATHEIPRDKFNPDELGRACLHMGPFRVGDPAAKVKSLLGEPHDTPPRPDGEKAWLYFLGERKHFPYFVAFVRNERIVALQVTGHAVGGLQLQSHQPRHRYRHAAQALRPGHPCAARRHQGH
jgi:hypothetical protein